MDNKMEYEPSGTVYSPPLVHWQKIPTASDMLREWEAAVGAPLPDHPELPTWESGTRKLRQDLLEEEWEEYRVAEAKNDIVGIADALADMMYVAIGTALVYGIDLDAVFSEVHRSNMTKVVPCGKCRICYEGVAEGYPPQACINPQVQHRADGKILKPDTYEPPNIAGVLGIE